MFDNDAMMDSMAPGQVVTQGQYGAPADVGYYYLADDEQWVGPYPTAEAAAQGYRSSR